MIFLSLQPIDRRKFIKLSSAGLFAASNLGLCFPRTASAATFLELRIEKAIKQLRRAGKLDRNERTSWSVYDFTSGVKLVSINEDKPMQAASMIKPFVAQAFFIQHNANPSRYPYSNNEKYLLERMIRYSNNSATNKFIDIVGKRSKRSYRPGKVEKVLKSYSPGLFKQTSIVEYIPRGGKTYRNSASAHDYSRFLYAMWNESLPMANEIKYYMGLPNKDRISTGVPNIPKSVDVYDKTGSTARMCGDMGIVVAKDRLGNEFPYTFVGMIDRDKRRGSYTSWIRSRSNILREISALTYDFMKETYKLS